MKLRFVFVLCGGLLFGLAARELPAQDEAAEQAAGTTEPTPTETLVLEMINRARANPGSEAHICAEIERVMNGVDKDMFLREMQSIEAAPPVFFDPRLVQAARRHSEYQAQHGITHDEVEGREGFTGETAMERVAAAGSPATTVGENVATGFAEAENIHAGFVVDPIGHGGDEGEGGMQPDRPHRVVTFAPGWRLVGVGSVAEDNPAATVVFAADGRRYAGGVVYADLDGDGFYSEGEGLSDTVISDGRTVVAGYQSGAYTIPINPAAGRLVMRVGPLSVSRRYARGDENVKIDIVLTAEEMETVQGILDLQARLLEDVRTKDIGEAEAHYRLMVQHYQNTALGPWLQDVGRALEMRQIYINTANQYLSRELPSQEALNTRLQQLQQLHQGMTTREFQAFGLEIGEKFLTLGRTGEIDGDLVSTAPSQQFNIVRPLPPDDAVAP